MNLLSWLLVVYHILLSNIIKIGGSRLVYHNFHLVYHGSILDKPDNSPISSGENPSFCPIFSREIHHFSLVKMALWEPAGLVAGLQRAALRALRHGVAEQLSQFGATQLSAAPVANGFEARKTGDLLNRCIYIYLHVYTCIFLQQALRSSQLRPCTGLC